MEFIPSDIAVLVAFSFKFEESRSGGTRSRDDWPRCLVPNVDSFVFVVEYGHVEWVRCDRLSRVYELR